MNFSNMKINVSHHYFQNVSRVDLVWDVYISNSLKSFTRNKRGKGVRQRVDDASPLPKNWKEFLRVDENKVELFKFLCDHSTKMALEDGKVLISTYGNGVKCSSPGIDLSRLFPCSHEEADTRILFHALDAGIQKLHRISSRTVDTDVVVLAITCFEQLQLEELWIAFGTGKDFRYLAIHEIVKGIGNDRSLVLGVFHAFTGCDTVSAFVGKGKKTAWDNWTMYQDVPTAFLLLSHSPDSVDDEIMQLIERFVVLLYQRTSELDDVNAARKDLFTQGRAIDAIPPTKDALRQHVMRATYQAGYVWGQALFPNPELPSPSS